MNKQASIFNPYSLLIMAVFVEYFPYFFFGTEPRIYLGTVKLSFTDIALLVLLFIYLFKKISNQSNSYANRRNSGRDMLIIFIIFTAYNCIKWITQGSISTEGIRITLSFASGFVFLTLFPAIITREDQLKYLFKLLLLFLVYIFILHIYAFARKGYEIHIFGGAFLSMLAPLYYLSIRNNALLKLSQFKSYLVKAIVITTYFMVGHRSGLIALLLGLIGYSFFYKRSAIKEVAIFLTIVAVSVGAALVVAPKVLTGVEDRASTTFDTSQSTYQGRFYNIFTVLDLSKEHPLMGKPLALDETKQFKDMEVTSGNIRTTISEFVVTPHNLVLEWLIWYGWLGVLIGISLLFLALRFIKNFLRDNKRNAQRYGICVAMLSAMIHNLFFALTNVTVGDTFLTYFLYFPLVVMIVIKRNEECFCN